MNAFISTQNITLITCIVEECVDVLLFIFIYFSLDERTVLMIGFILMVIGFFVLIPMGNELPKVGISGK